MVASVFWDAHGIMFIECLEKGKKSRMNFMENYKSFDKIVKKKNEQEKSHRGRYIDEQIGGH